jgi:hypothetical protein
LRPGLRTCPKMQMQMPIRTKPRATALRNLAMQCAVMNRTEPREAQRPRTAKEELTKNIIVDS